jgi:ribonuclease J
MLALTKPKFFFPAHGELRMLRAHAKTAVSMGVPPENMVIASNGDVVEVSPKSIRIAGKVRSGIELLDNSRVATVAQNVLKDRQRIAVEGLVLISLAVSPTGQLVAAPAVSIRALARSPQMQNLEVELAQVVVDTLRSRWRDHVTDRAVDWEALRISIEKAAQFKIRNYLPGRPLVIVQLSQGAAIAQDSLRVAAVV